MDACGITELGEGWIEEDDLVFVVGFDWTQSTIFEVRGSDGSWSGEDRTDWVEVCRWYADETSSAVLLEWAHDDSSAADGIAYMQASRAANAAITAGSYFQRWWSVSPDGDEKPFSRGWVTLQEGRPS